MTSFKLNPPPPRSRLTSEAVVFGEDDDKALRVWTEGDKQPHVLDSITFHPENWPVGTVVRVYVPEETTS